MSSRAAIAASCTDLWPFRHASDSSVHVRAALGWLCRAQDAVSGGGVSYGYDLHIGWHPPYPETTGYIITTFLQCARESQRWGIVDPADLVTRAHRMAAWLTTVQLPSGALPGGTTAIEPTPTVFNTGQILEGWCEAERDRTGPMIRNSLTRAADWLVEVQDDDGCWRRYLSPLTVATPATYNVRSAWALLRAGRLCEREDWQAAALRNFDWALTQQTANGWFDLNCLTDCEHPLTHTIGYTLESFLDAGETAKIERYLVAVQTASDHLIKAVHKDGFLSGRFNRAWQPHVRWCCLTGSCQLALTWFRLSRITGDPIYADAARRVLNFVSATQRFGQADSRDGMHGGIKGSHPVWGGYDPFRYPNWAAKFFIDAHLAAI